MTKWSDVYEWLKIHPAHLGRTKLEARQQMQVVVYFRMHQRGSGKNLAAEYLGVSREYVRQLLARVKGHYDNPKANINWTVYHWLLENYPTETSIGQRCRALESLQLKVEGLSYDEIAVRRGGESLMHSTRCAWARTTYRRAMGFFVELMNRLVLIIEQE